MCLVVLAVWLEAEWAWDGVSQYLGSQGLSQGSSGGQQAKASLVEQLGVEGHGLEVFLVGAG